MNSQFGELFLFLTNLAWKSRVTIPVVLTAILMAAGIRLQIDINIQTGRTDDIEELEDESEDDEWETAESDSEAEVVLRL